MNPGRVENIQSQELTRRKTGIMVRGDSLLRAFFEELRLRGAALIEGLTGR